jgi:hypothetical protein
MRAALVACIMTVAHLAFADVKPRERAVVGAIDLGPAVPMYLAAKATTQIEEGLAAAGYDVVPSGENQRLASELAGCREGTCVRRVGETLGVQAVVYATIRRQDDNTVITMRLFDASTASQAAEVNEVCELCGEAELSERLGVAASTLRARAVEARERRDKLAVKPQPPLPPVQPPPRVREKRSLVPGIVIGASGVLVLGGGIFLIAIDGRGMCSPGDQPVFPASGAVIRYRDPANPSDYVCRDIYKTRSLGIVGTGLGVIALAAGTALVIRARGHERTVELTPIPGGAAVKVSVPW